MAIDTAKLRNRCAIQVPIRTRTVQGGVSDSWATLRTVYCQIQPLSAPLEFLGQWRGLRTGREINFASKTKSMGTHRITMRAQPEWITSDMRFVESVTRFNKPVKRVFNMNGAQVCENVNYEMLIEVTENISDNDSPVADYGVVTDDDGNAILDDQSEYVAS